MKTVAVETRFFVVGIVSENFLTVVRHRQLLRSASLTCSAAEVAYRPATESNVEVMVVTVHAAPVDQTKPVQSLEPVSP